VNENVNVEVTVEESKKPPQKPDKKGEKPNKPQQQSAPSTYPPTKDGLLRPPKQYPPRPPSGNNPANNPPNVQQNLSAVPAGLPLQTFNVTTPYLPPQYQAQFDTFLRNMYVPFIYKDYHIGGVNGPNDNHLQASMIYEDALPAATVYTTFASLKERNSLCKYARSMFIKMEDGEDIDFNGGENSLNSRLKLIELNPYSTNYFSNNPYKGLPAGLLIYRSCYPIMYDAQKATVECRKSSVGLNVRIYKVEVEAYRAVNPNFQMPINQNQGLTYLPSAINYSQNLPQYTPLQYIPPDAKQVLSINDVVNSQIPRTKTVFEAINAPVIEDFYMGIPKYVPNNTTNTIITNPVPSPKIANVIPKINSVMNNVATGKSTDPVTVSIKTDIIDPKTKYDFDVWREVGYYQYIRDTLCKPMVCPNFVQSYCYFICQSSDFNFDKNTMNNYTNSMIAAAKSKIESSKKAIVILTESPNYNIYTWASNSYVRQNNIKKQTYTGYKPDNVWLVILAQMMIVFYVMFKYEFTFNDMIFQNNFYIKDMNAPTGDSQKFWIYRIDGFDYYLPNYGHLLLCDSDYHDMDDTQTKKVIGKPFLNLSSTNPKKTDDETPHVHEVIMENVYRCTNNVLGPEFTQVNGVQPSGDVLNMLKTFNDTVRSATNDIKGKTPVPPDAYRVAYKDILHNNLKNFLHNRVGTVLRDNEVNYIRKEDPKPPKIGSMMVNEYQVDKYRFVIFKDYVTGDTDTAFCYAKADFNNPTPTAKPEIIIERINKSQLYNYSENISIKPDAKPDEPAMGLDYILETYII
jgi:hypothetical protein